MAPAQSQMVMGHDPIPYRDPEIRAQSAAVFADIPSADLGAYADFVRDYYNADPLTKLTAVNGLVNRVIDPDPTPRNWRVPSVVARLTSGNCKDYVAMKMALLHRLGFPLEDMSVLVVDPSTVDDELHAVLVVKYYGLYWVMDNLTGAIRDVNELTGYRPVYSVAVNAMQRYGEFQ